jgi:hypoxanthine phosphoribosyltransferase
MKKDISKVLFSKTDIKKAIKRVGTELTEKYKNQQVTILSLLNGSFVFTADLIREFEADVVVKFLKVKSYEGSSSSGVLNVETEFKFSDLDNKHVLIIDDILDTGLTLNTICKKIRNETEALSVTSCVLLDKQVERKTMKSADFTCFEISNEFVVGYGLDYNERYRNLPYIGVLDEKVYS